MEIMLAHPNKIPYGFTAVVAVCKWVKTAFV